MNRRVAQLGGTPPWHMWGQAKQLLVTSGGVVTTPSTSGQICRVSYRRPDTFKFLLAATIVGTLGPGGAPITPGSLSVRFDVTVGIGLAQITLSPFGRPLVFQWGGAGPLGQQKWFATAQTPVINDQDATPQTLQSDTIVAQNIQVATTCILQTPTNGDTVTVDVQAMFSPVTHIRPDWYGQTQGEEYDSERGGR